MKNKNDNNGIALILVFSIILVLLAMLIVNSAKTKEKCYEYALNGEIGVSSNCYYSDNAYCEIGNKVIKVDCYYTTD